MSNSSLATYIDTSTLNCNSRKYPITRITIHHAAGVINDLSVFSSILRSGREVSYNYGIDNSGRIGLFVPENKRAWTSSSPDNDHRAITIEVSNSKTGGDWPVSNAAYNALLNLCEDICRRNGIAQLTYTGSLSGSNLTMHQWFASTACPGPYLKSRFGLIANAVNRRLGTSGASTSLSNAQANALLEGQTVNAYTAATTGFADPSTINYEVLDPYLITLDRTSPDGINFSRLKDIGVVGVLIEAGYLYNSIHSEVTFNSPKLESQVQACIDADLPFGLYFDAKARNTTEAKNEMYRLSFPIRIYPPALGVWIHPKLPGSKVTNSNIIDTYYKELTRLGLQDRVGFYCTRTELNSIDWDKYQDTWYLWLNDHIDTVSDLETLLVPQFFVLDQSSIEKREQEFLEQYGGFNTGGALGGAALGFMVGGPVGGLIGGIVGGLS